MYIDIMSMYTMVTNGRKGSDVCFPNNFFPLSLLSFPPSFSIPHHQEGPKDTMRTSELIEISKIKQLSHNTIFLCYFIVTVV